MTLLLVAVGIAVVAGVAVLVARDRPVLDDDPMERPVMAWPPPGPVAPEDLAAARFTVALRGYRMDEVDRVLDDAREALAQRDSRIADLEGVVTLLSSGTPPPTGSTDATDATDPGARPAEQR